MDDALIPPDKSEAVARGLFEALLDAETKLAYGRVHLERLLTGK
jgi:hypothetical protein